MYAAFNPRTHMECDAVRRINDVWPTHFQSTHSHGVRRFTITVTHEINGLSIHALTWSATVTFAAIF
ncbi:Uncharacterised protein [Paenibacillus macerans]|uniref:Uncharacterized protein n=1 Tax=Paenibacillus macerans TaxID=44252 RepID=A0A090Y5I8_PAEMA|nr:hypothetical protein DJ90_4790 [Paenibacillus macerans]SUA86356.1 Uncharacterised protein [Paenibacillus macerans]